MIAALAATLIGQRPGALNVKNVSMAAQKSLLM
jgi:hypothetical protein